MAFLRLVQAGWVPRGACIASKIALKAEAVKAGARTRAGRATGNRRQGMKGRTGQAMASIKQAGEKIKDAFRH